MLKTLRKDTQKLVLLAILTAIVITLQVLAVLVPTYPFNYNLALIPIVIGAAMISPLAACWLGIVFGTVVLLSDPVIIFFWVHNPVMTILVVLIRGALSGFFAGVIYRMLEDKGKIIAVIVAAIVCAITNTGIFVIGAYAFFLPVLEAFGIEGLTNIASYAFSVMITINFLIELGICLVFSPVIIRLIQYGNTIFGKSK